MNAAITAPDYQTTEYKGEKEMQQINNPVKPFSNGGGSSIVDHHGEEVKPARLTLMATLNQTAKEDVTLTKGTLTVIGALIALAGLSITCIVLFVGWAREDQSNREKTVQIQSTLDQVQKEQEQINSKLDKLTEKLQQQREAEAVKRGYELKAAEGDHK